MKVLKIAAAVIAGLFVVVAAVGFMLPEMRRVERSITIDAPSTAIYPLVANFKTGWPQWNPFGPDKDPGLQLSYAGTEEGVGAIQSWDGPQSGDGRAQIVKADPQTGIEYDMVMMHESFRVKGSLLCEPAAKGTKLTWAGDFHYGNNPFRRYLGLFIESALDEAYDEGLGALKKKAEARVAEARAATTAIQ